MDILVSWEEWQTLFFIFFFFFFLVLACFLEVVEGRLFRLSVMGISVELTDTFISVSMTLT